MPGEAAITGGCWSLPERFQAMEAFPGAINPATCLLAAGANEAKHQASGEGVTTTRKFAEQVLRDGAVVQSTEAILQTR